MASHSQQMQTIFARYQKEVSDNPVDLKEVGRWAIDNGLWQPRPIDIQSKFASEMATALREEYRTDKKGRRYRSKLPARKKASGGETLFQWADIDTAERPHVELALQQRRKQIVGDCHQLRVDTDHWNDANPSSEQIEMIYDFTDDVEEMFIAEGIEDAA
ncbi:MAG: hypothetical protein JKY45_08910 [Emcibacter sp.]|nr:hypothetical protein [Emcibacter sp.]